MNFSAALRISTPGRRPASHRIWKPLQMPSKRPPRWAWARTALAIAFNDKCDVVVATVVAGDVAAAERAALGFLNGDLVLRWAEKELGL